VIFAAFRVFDGVISYGRFKSEIELSEYDHSKASEHGKVNISISLTKIKVSLHGDYLQHRVA
jgi:hypothetical protein